MKNVKIEKECLIINETTLKFFNYSDFGNFYNFLKTGVSYCMKLLLVYEITPFYVMLPHVASFFQENCRLEGMISSLGPVFIIPSRHQ